MRQNCVCLYVFSLQWRTVRTLINEDLRRVKDEECSEKSKQRFLQCRACMRKCMQHGAQMRKNARPRQCCLLEF